MIFRRKTVRKTADSRRQPLWQSIRCDPGLRSGALHQFEAVTEGIEDVDAAKIIEGGVGFSEMAGALASRDDIVEIVHNKRWMRALGRMEIGLHAEVKIHGAGHEPYAVASRHLGRLLD